MGGHTQGVSGHCRARTIRPIIRGHCKGGCKACAVAVGKTANRLRILGVQGDRVVVAHRHRHTRAVVFKNNQLSYRYFYIRYVTITVFGGNDG